MKYTEKVKYLGLFVLITMITSLSSLNCISQNLNIVEVAGRISSYNNEPVKYAKVKLNSKGKTIISDSKGMFSLFASKGDTISFSCVGYTSFKVQIPDSILGMLYYLDVPLAPDTVVIDPVILFPWKTYPEFKAAVLAFKPPYDRDVENAMRNIALVCAQAMQYDGADPARNFNYVMQHQMQMATYKGMSPSISLLNPFAWVSFVKSIKDGSLVNSKDLPPLPDERK